TEVWRQCVHWLIETGVLPRDHKTCQRHGTLFDLAQTLRDGVILCNLLNIIQPGAVDFNRINLRPQMLQFSCLQNIRIAVNSLSNVFRLPEIFQPGDLYNMTNFAQVLQVLSLLSHTPPSSYKFRTPVYVQEQEEDIYRLLPDMARELADEEENLYDSVPEDRHEGIYGSIIDFKQPSSQHKDKRSYCISEIIETEKNYVQHLGMMVCKFMEPFRQMNGIEEKDVRMIFMNIEDLLPIHQDFLRELEKSSSESPSTLSKPFLTYKDRFLLYGTYCCNLNESQEHLDHLKKSSQKMAIFVEECEAVASPSKFKLRELLCVPMQRILKYHLLVKELHKHTMDKHPDKSELAKALESMQELSHYVNEVKRDSEMMVTINEVQSCLSGFTRQTLTEYGRLQKDGELRIRSSMDKKAKSRNTFLFDQALFMTKEENGVYHLKDLVRLEEYKLEEVAQAKANKWNWTWSLIATKNGSNFTLFAKTHQDKGKWIENLKVAFENISPRELKNKSHNFKMHSFSEPTYCASCKKLLLGTFFQGYLCERTNTKCHKLCLSDALRKIECKYDIIIVIRTIKHHSKKKRNITASPQMYQAHRDYNRNPWPPFPGAKTISFSSGEYVMVTDQTNSDWWMGHTVNDLDRKGYFPASFVSPAVSYPESDWFVNVGYAGNMDRSDAEKALYGKPSGTYLVRTSKGNLAISLIYSSDMKHIRIHKSPEGFYYVAECKNFRSIQELVRYYQENSMSASFLGLETNLQIPFRDPNYFPSSHPPAHGRWSSNSVLYNFEPRSQQELRLRAGQSVNIISKAGDGQGWWKGECQGQVGYFPAKFTEE
uniref:Guanine nucleotide exchange factor VAV2 n=1 Tax=Ciona savignyi TaxID=51511 RepID=H2YQP4_CIOSA